MRSRFPLDGCVDRNQDRTTTRRLYEVTVPQVAAVGRRWYRRPPRRRPRTDPDVGGGASSVHQHPGDRDLESNRHRCRSTPARPPATSPSAPAPSPSTPVTRSPCRWRSRVSARRARPALRLRRDERRTATAVRTGLARRRLPASGAGDRRFVAYAATPTAAGPTGGTLTLLPGVRRLVDARRRRRHHPRLLQQSGRWHPKTTSTPSPWRRRVPVRSRSATSSTTLVVARVWRTTPVRRRAPTRPRPVRSVSSSSSRT